MFYRRFARLPSARRKDLRPVYPWEQEATPTPHSHFLRETQRGNFILPLSEVFFHSDGRFDARTVSTRRMPLLSLGTWSLCHEDGTFFLFVFWLLWVFFGRHLSSYVNPTPNLVLCQLYKVLTRCLQGAMLPSRKVYKEFFTSKEVRSMLWARKQKVGHSTVEPPATSGGRKSTSVPGISGDKLRTHVRRKKKLPSLGTNSDLHIMASDTELGGGIANRVKRHKRIRAKSSQYRDHITLWSLFI